MKRIGLKYVMAAIAACAMVKTTAAADVRSSKFESTYYKDFPQFHPYIVNPGKR